MGHGPLGGVSVAVLARYERRAGAGAVNVVALFGSRCSRWRRYAHDDVCRARHGMAHGL